VFFFLLSPLLIPLAFARLLGFVPHGLNSLFYTYSTQVVNYFFVITLTPPAIIIHHKYFGGFGPEGWCYINKYLCYRCGGSKVMQTSELEKKTQTESAAMKGDSESGIELQNDFKPTRVPGAPTPAIAAPVQPSITEPLEDNNIDVNEDTDLLSKILIRAFEFELPESFGKLKVCQVSSCH
jgi:hypothetical protein